MEPDDPQNVKRPTPPPYEDPTSLRKEFEIMYDQTAEQIKELGPLQRMSRKMRGFLGYCFMAETGMLATEVCIVQKPGHTPGSMIYWFEKRSTVEAVRQRIDVLEAENRCLKAEISMLMGQLDHLKQKAGTKG